MKELNCTYKEEQYSVRDNGEVLRHPIIGKRLRPNDSRWTFGKLNNKTGYLEIASVRIHRIVATAFHGAAPSIEHVVDHIENNKQNNRPENLRWLTKLENIVLNPITARRIELVCGSVEDFLSDPAKFRDFFPEPNYQWMCTVSKEEAQICLQRLLAWAKSGQLPTKGYLGDWVFESAKFQNQDLETVNELSDIILSKTLNAAQRDWKIPSEFPCCPETLSDDPILAYNQNLIIGIVFCCNDIYNSVVSQSGISNDRQSIYVLTESKDNFKPWALTKITYESDLFIHSSFGTFIERHGAAKQFCLELGLDWNGPDSIDDYC